jgi:hypothetical protein
MPISLLAVAAAMSLGQFDRFGSTSESGRLLATRRPYALNVVDDVRRPGFNGRLWIGHPIIGGTAGPYLQDLGEPGPLSYGADQDRSSYLYAHIGQLALSLDPWTAIPEEGMYPFEDARNQWLKENGYTGGVRTFVNDLYLFRRDAQPTSLTSITPHASFQLAPDMPRHQGRMRVLAPTSSHAPAALAAVFASGAGDPARISWPMNAPIAMAKVTHLGTTAVAMRVAQASK